MTALTAVVVGAGIGGLSAARALHRGGWSVRVLERAQSLDPVGAGISLWPNAVHALAALEVSLGNTALALGSGGIRTRSGRWLRRVDANMFPARYRAPLLSVHRADLQTALLSSIAARTVQIGTTVTHVRQQGGNLVIDTTDGSCEADLVVIADGLDSTLRHYVSGPGPQPRYAGYTAWRAVTPPHAAHEVPLSETWGNGQRFGMVPLAYDRTYWFATSNAPEGQRAPSGEHVDLLRRFAGWPSPVLDLIAATDPAAVTRHDVYDLHPDPVRYVRGRVVLLGDAAHAMTPDLGQGAGQALEDAVTLGHLLSAHADLDSALASYDRRRRPRAQRIARRSRQVGRAGQLAEVPATRLRDLVLTLVPDQLADRQLDATVRWRPPSGPATHIL